MFLSPQLFIDVYEISTVTSSESRSRYVSIVETSMHQKMSGNKSNSLFCNIVTFKSSVLGEQYVRKFFLMSRTFHIFPVRHHFADGKFNVAFSWLCFLPFCTTISKQVLMRTVSFLIDLIQDIIRFLSQFNRKVKDDFA